MRSRVVCVGVCVLASCGAKFDKFAQESPIVNKQAALVISPLDGAPGRLVLINLDGTETECDAARGLDPLLSTACVLYDLTSVQAGSVSSVNFNHDQVAFSAAVNTDIEAFVTGVAAPLEACASGELPFGGACDVSLNPVGDDLSPVFGLSPTGVEAVLFQGTSPQDTDLDAIVDTFTTDISASTGASINNITFASRLNVDLTSIPSQPISDLQNQRQLLSIEEQGQQDLFVLGPTGAPSTLCDANTARLGACPIVASALNELGAVPQPVVNRLYVLRQSADAAPELAFVNADGSAPAECPAPSVARDEACVIAAAEGLPTFTDDGRFMLFPEVDPAEEGATRLRLMTLNGDDPAACLAPFSASGAACVLDVVGASLHTPGLLPL